MLLCCCWCLCQLCPSTLGRAAAAISVSVSARREINGPLCGGEGASAGEQGLRWREGSLLGN